ncbi:MAG: SGNH/GDSL hydrolase family protein [Luteolibacter sp.]
MKILFQGDSVTDCQRDRKDPQGLGGGYVRIIADALGAADMEFSAWNRGISGNRVRDLVERWDEDCLDLKPNLLSILIGINDVWRHFDRGLPIDHADVHRQYRTLLERAATQSPQLILMEPFLIPAAPEKVAFRPVLNPVIQIVRELAVEFGAALVPLDGLFAAACSWRPAGFWAEDGVHPTAAGHRLIADAWLDVYQSLTSDEVRLTHFNHLSLS